MGRKSNRDFARWLAHLLRTKYSGEATTLTEVRLGGNGALPPISEEKYSAHRQHPAAIATPEYIVGGTAPVWRILLLRQDYEAQLQNQKTHPGHKAQEVQTVHKYMCGYCKDSELPAMWGKFSINGGYCRYHR